MRRPDLPPSENGCAEGISDRRTSSCRRSQLVTHGTQRARPTTLERRCAISSITTYTCASHTANPTNRLRLLSGSLVLWEIDGTSRLTLLGFTDATLPLGVVDFPLKQHHRTRPRCHRCCHRCDEAEAAAQVGPAFECGQRAERDQLAGARSVGRSVGRSVSLRTWRLVLLPPRAPPPRAPPPPSPPPFSLLISLITASSELRRASRRQDCRRCMN
jgi:hypothetical protein